MENILIEKFDNFIDKCPYTIWKSYSEIEEITGIDIHDVIKIIDNNGKFCQNSENKYTTRKMYKKYRSFTDKLLDSFANKIR